MDRNADFIPFQSAQGDGPETALVDYARACRRRIKLIVACAVGFAVVAAVWSLMQTPLYQSKATVVVNQEGPSALDKDRGYNPDLTPEYFQTQFELMKSHHVFQRTAQLLHLSERPEYKPNPSALRSLVGGLMPAPPTMDVRAPNNGATEPPSEEVDDRLLKRFSESIDIVPIRGARLAHVIATSEDPKFAAQTANTLASVYIERTQELNALSKEKSVQWVTGNLDGLRKKAEAAQQALYLFRVKHGLLGGRDRQSVTVQTNSELDTELVRAEMKRAEAQSRMEQIQSVLRNRTGQDGVIEIDWSSLDSLSEVLTSPLIQTLRAQDIRVSGQVAELAEKYGPLHPKLARAKAEMQDLRERIRQEVQKIFDSVKLEYNAAISRARVIKEAAGRHRQEKILLERHEIEYGTLEREAESTQQIYNIFLKQTKETDLSAGLVTANVYLADPAVPSSIPVKPKKQLNTLLGLVLGLMAGVGIALVLESRDRTLKGPDDLEQYLPRVSLLGMVPLLPKAETGERAQLTSDQSSGATAESIRIIRTSVLFSNPNKLPACVLITSPGESEGKTTLSVNLAIAMAQLKNTRVLLIDADLRKPAHRFIHGIQRDGGQTKGLAGFLAGRFELDDIIHHTNIPNLSVIPRGKRPSNPSELLYSDQMGLLLNRCREEGYHVILDAPPVLPVTDPVILASQVDGVLLVASVGQTTKEACRLAIQRLTAAGGKILGIVLQKVQVPDNSYYCHLPEETDEAVENGVAPEADEWTSSSKF
ncbi:MAG: polysaccharide biosynthesis tyrosine autokinase [Nitrospira sp.]|nr:MAG: polysaccharide biosynthesis tyrosine autokinase [Nitrospira sp.]